jgi:hypothetical protein
VEQYRKIYEFYEPGELPGLAFIHRSLKATECWHRVQDQPFVHMDDEEGHHPPAARAAGSQGAYVTSSRKRVWVC